MRQDLPHPGPWRRLYEGARPLGDRARVQVQRGTTIVLERLPGADDERVLEGMETDLGALRSGDRLVLQVQVPLPGRLALLHAVLGDPVGELSVVLPLHAGEEEARRAFEVVEVAGELEAVPGAPEQGLLCLWVPELLPAGWLHHALSTGCLPSEARAWLYRYRVE